MPLSISSRLLARSARCAVLSVVLTANAAAKETVRVAFIDPLSGPFANAGELAYRHFRAAFATIAEPGTTRLRAAGAPRLEIVGFDNKASPQESLQQLRAVVDQGIRYVVQGQSSAAALALSDAISKHNQRDPARAVLFLNYAALDPDLTNSKCSFWHFRFDASSDMRAEALLSTLDSRARRVYLIGQNYSFGQHLARAAREIMARRRPDVRIVGDELHPLGQVRDFAPYIAKIRASGADTVVTGNWGNDLTLLVRAAREAGLQVDFLTFFAGSLGAVTAIGDAGVGRVKQVTEWHANAGVPALDRVARDYKERYREDYYFARIGTLTAMLAEGFRRAGSVEPLRVARVLSGMRLETPLGEVEMRRADHQLIQPLYVSTLTRTARHGGPREVVHDVEATGLGFRTDQRIEGYRTALPTSCQMERP